MNRLSTISTLLVCMLVLSGCGQLIKPSIEQDIVEIKQGNYILDKAHATVLFKVNHMGFSTFVGRFNSFDANLQFNSEDMTKSSLKAAIDMASVDINNEKFERALKGKFWFNAEVYPQAIFETVSAERVSEESIHFHGQLTFLGTQKPLTLIVNVNGAGRNRLNGKYTLGFSASTQFKRSDFGLDQYIPAVGDEIQIEVHAEFQRKGE